MLGSPAVLLKKKKTHAVIGHQNFAAAVKSCRTDGQNISSFGTWSMCKNTTPAGDGTNSTGNFHRCLSTSSIPWCEKVKNDQKSNQGVEVPFFDPLCLQGDHHCACAQKWCHFSYFFKSFQPKKIKALRPKMTKIASRVVPEVFCSDRKISVLFFSKYPTKNFC